MPDMIEMCGTRYYADTIARVMCGQPHLQSNPYGKSGWLRARSPISKNERFRRNRIKRLASASRMRNRPR
jgi:hypothetical protein